MRYSKLLAPTLREVPSEAEIASHQLMLRGGLMRKVASGLYTYLPLGWRTIEKIKRIVKEEMDKSGGQEIMMPILQPAELWEESGRWSAYGAEMIRITDRHGREFCLGPTHEEVITSLVSGEYSSYKQLPALLYQIQNKYRDERRPRFGLMRSREFIMKDAYSFDRDEAGLDEMYKLMYDTYVKIFTRCGVDFRPVEADNGAIGGSSSHEFMVLAESGEAEVLYCDSCDYAANREIAQTVPAEQCNDAEAELAKVETPHCQTIEAVSDYLKMDTKQTMKALVYSADGEVVLIFVRGDRQLNEVRLQNFLGCTELDMATEAQLADAGLKKGFIGPVGIENIRVLIDEEVANGKNLCCGANEEGYHLVNANYGRDYSGEVSTFRLIEAGEKCPHCDGTLLPARGIEVGQVFKLGTKYSKAMGAEYLDEQGQKHPMVMGCYGIGVGRTMAACIEQNHDENGIIWPVAIAPYQVIIVPVSEKKADQMEAAENLYKDLTKLGVEVLLDDRAERAGVKFKDADLLGIPLRITIGPKALADGKVEYKARKTGEEGAFALETAAADIANMLKTIF